MRSDEGDPVPFKIPLARLWRLDISGFCLPFEFVQHPVLMKGSS